MKSVSFKNLVLLIIIRSIREQMPSYDNIKMIWELHMETET